jgi:hypothetical protein
VAHALLRAASALVPTLLPNDWTIRRLGLT